MAGFGGWGRTRMRGASRSSFIIRNQTSPRRAAVSLPPEACLCRAGPWRARTSGECRVRKIREKGGLEGEGGSQLAATLTPTTQTTPLVQLPPLKELSFFFLTACVLTVTVESPRPCAWRGASTCLSSMHLLLWSFLLPRTRKTSSGTLVCKNRRFSAVKILQTITRDLISRWI